MRKWVSCALAGATLLAFATAARALPYYVTVQPIQVCNTDGTSCAGGALTNFSLFADATNKIWAQAGIEVRFEDWHTFNSDTYYSYTSIDEFGGLASAPDNGASSLSKALNMFFVDFTSDSIYGEASVGGKNSVINEVIFGISRLDTMAHEIGHNLGLNHNDFGAGGSDNLMTSGGARDAPTSIDQIYPDTLGLDFLTAEQIAKVLTSQWVVFNDDYVPPTEVAVPEPHTLVVFLIGLMIAGGTLVSRPRARPALAA